MNPLFLGATVVGAVLLLTGKKSSKSPLAGMEDLLSATALDPGMSPEAFNRWQRDIAMEGNPNQLKAEADQFQAAGFLKSAERLRIKESRIRAALAA